MAFGLSFSEYHSGISQRIFLFGGLFKAPSSWGAFIGLLIYLLINLLWILPIVAFFIGLNDYRRGYQKRGIAILVCGNILTLLDILFIL